MCNQNDYKDMDLLPGSLFELDLWHKYYLPIREGQVVVDIGASDGATARFYLLHGASQVIAIESSPQAWDKLMRNFANEDRVIPLLATVGHIKVDIEGAEKGSMIALHNDLKFVEKHHFGSPACTEHIYKIE